jgi:GNAT superfamily N-acetyltransferase
MNWYKIRKIGINRLLKACLTRFYCHAIISIYRLSLKDYTLIVNSKLPLKIKLVVHDNVSDAISMDKKCILENFKSMLNNEQVGYYAYHENKVVGRAWVIEGPALAPTFFNFTSYKIDKNELFIHFCATGKNFRKMNIFSKILNHILEEYRDKGYNTAYTAVSKINTPSIRGIEKVGFQVALEQDIRILLNKKTVKEKYV